MVKQSTSPTFDNTHTPSQYHESLDIDRSILIATLGGSKRGDIYAATTLSDTQESGSLRDVELDNCNQNGSKLVEISRTQSPPPKYPISEASASAPPSPRPPPFSSLYRSTAEAVEAYKTAVTEAGASSSVPAYAPVQFDPYQGNLSSPSGDVVAETKAALPPDTKGESAKNNEEEPPPAYAEGSCPLHSFIYLMAAAGGAASILTQVQQGGLPTINTLGGKLGRHIALD